MRDFMPHDMAGSVPEMHEIAIRFTTA